MAAKNKRRIRNRISKFKEDIQPAAKDPTHPLAAGLGTFDLAEMVRTRLYEDRAYARWRRKTWRRQASVTRLATLACSATATILIGLSGTNDVTLKNVGFVFSALVTTVAAIEPYFNWRSRWVMSEEALGRWHEIEESLSLYVAETQEADLDRERILAFDRSRREVWSAFNQQWIEQRRASPESAPTATG